MNRILLFILFCLLPFAVIGQITTGVLNIAAYIRQGAQDDWYYNMMTDHEYDQNGNLTHTVRRTWNGSVWVNQIRLPRSYNANGQMDHYYYHNWDAQNNSWKNYRQSFYTYNASGKIQEVLTEAWDADHWNNNSKSIYTYDENSYLINVLQQTWITSTLTWKDAAQQIYVNSGDGLPIDYIRQTKTLNTWVNQEHEARTYTPENKLSNVLLQSWPSGQWQNLGNTDYTYDDNHYLIERIGQSWNEEGWHDIEKYQYTNNSNGTVAEVIMSSWQTDFWFDNIKEVYSYNALSTSENNPEQIGISPNPAQDELRLASNDTSVSNIRIVDLQGRTIPITDSSYERIDISTLSNGMYLLQFEIDGKSVSKKFLKN